MFARGYEEIFRIKYYGVVIWKTWKRVCDIVNAKSSRLVVV